MMYKKLKRTMAILLASGMVFADAAMFVNADENLSEQMINDGCIVEDTISSVFDDELAVLYEENPEIFDMEYIKYLSEQSVPAQTIAEDDIVPLTLHQGVSDQITVPGEVNTYSFTSTESSAQKCGIQIVVRDVPDNLDPVINITYNDTGETITINKSKKGEREEYRSGLFELHGGVSGAIRFNASGKNYPGLENNVVYNMEADEHETVRQTAVVSSTVKQMSSGVINITVKLYFQYRNKIYV